MVGQTLGHYRIVEKIGAGGMGEVYRAHDEHLERDVALKVLPSGTLADESARKQFRKEALALSRLNHPNIAIVFDFDTQEGVDFLAMELVPGEALNQSLKAGALKEKEVLNLGTQLAEGLAAAHAQGIVHRDLKPGNLLITPEGRLKILDFGLAKLLGPSVDPDVTRSLAETRAAAGTLPYMSPEQLQGEPPDARTDIFAAGVVLYEMTTGRRPFEETLSTALVNDIIHKPPRPPGRLNPKVSPKLQEIILKCLEKEPENRYQLAKELQVDLRRLTAQSTAAPVEPSARLSWVYAAAGVAVLLVAGALVGTNVGGWRQRLLGRPSSPRIESIAVLPLENLSHDPEQEYFADGMTDAVITDLAKIGALRVISRTSVMRYKRTQKSIPEIAKELNVDAVMEGSIEHSGNRVRITAQLIRAATDQNLWAEAYDRDMRDVLSVQGEIARSIAGEVQVKLTPQEQALLTKGRPIDPEAYELYLKGRYFWLKSTKESIDKAIGLYQQAIDRDPAYAPPYSGLADCYTTLGVSFGVGALSPTQAISQARAAAEKAIELDDAMAEGHNSLAMTKLLFDWDWAGSEAEFKRALELNPGSANVHHSYAHLLIADGRREQALAESKRALDLDRLSTVMNLHLGWHYIYARQYDLALDQLRKTLELDPNFGYAYWYMGRAYEQQGKYADALQAMQRAQDLLKGNIDVAADTGHVYAISGDKSAAFRVLEQLKEASRKTYVSPSEVALIYVALDAKTEAFQRLERGYTERSDLLIYLNVEPRFDSIRSDPRFIDLVHRVGLSQ